MPRRFPAIGLACLLILGCQQQAGGRVSGGAAAPQVAPTSLGAAPPTERHPAALSPDARLLVTRVVDGDTLRVDVAGAEETVRLIGVDTPETVDPRRPVERFGKEASEFTRRLAEGKRVELREEIGGQNRDRYRRLLRYVYLEDGTLVNAEIIRQGFGHAYVRFPFSMMDEFLALERQARERGRGLWADEEDASAAREAKRTTAAREARVYVTREGSQYHRVGCRHLNRSMIPMELKEAARRYAPCGVCRPPVAESIAP